ncbi:MAG: hypothetical protein K2X47_11810 [Bdellovibrionales bacterium]|nr:hypothetical protein [Bdellovibrionales bacterium]
MTPRPTLQLKWPLFMVLCGAYLWTFAARAERFAIEGFQLLDEQNKIVIQSERADGLRELKFESLKNFQLKIDLPKGVLKIKAPKALLKEKREIVFSGPAEVELTNKPSLILQKWMMPDAGLGEFDFSALSLRFSRVTWEFGAIGDSLQIDLKKWRGRFHGSDIEGPMQKVLKKDWPLENSLKKKE